MALNKPVKIKAYGKINLTLDILGFMDNGYHRVEMIMQQVSVYDSIAIRHNGEEGTVVKSNCAWLPCDNRNLAWKAVKAFSEATGCSDSIRVDMLKFIPVSAGMAGGSSDAAAVLKGLNILYKAGLTVDELCEIGKKIGSDVPFCIKGGTMLAAGTGDELYQLPPMPNCYILLAKPKLNISTPAAYAEFDKAEHIVHPNTVECIRALENNDLMALCKGMHNVFEDARTIPEVEKLKSIMQEHGAICANMSGSGPTVFGIFTELKSAEAAKMACRPYAPFVFCCRPVDPLTKRN